MAALIDDLLTLAREGEPVHDLSAVDLAPTVETYWQNVETVEATLVTRTECTIRADPSRLQQLLENLIRNAIEHGGTDVTVTVGELDDGFYVGDDGPGIPDDIRDKVFQRGYSTSPDGTGFGLAIVNRITKAHDWTIDVAEGDQGGTQFEITAVEFTDR
jgi:signal transduction histidine kinase